MKITREQRGQNVSLLKVLVDEKDYGEAVDKMLRDYKRKANIPGFRPGMVPMGVIRKMYGKSAVAEQSYRTPRTPSSSICRRRVSTMLAMSSLLTSMAISSSRTIPSMNSCSR